MSRMPNAQRMAESLLLLFVAASILWRGGKSIDMTWALGAVMLAVVFAAWWYPIVRLVGLPKQDSRMQPMTVPLGIWGMLLFFLVWTGLSYVLSSTRTYGLDEVLRDGALVMLFVWIVRRAGNAKMSLLHDGFPWVVTVAAALATLFGIAVYVFQPVNRFVGTFLDWRFHTDYWPNAWAQFVLLAWPLAALLATRETDAFRRKACTFVVGLLVGSLLLSYSRGALISFAGQVACAVLVWAVLALRDVRVGKAAAREWSALAVKATAALGIALVVFASANALRATRYDVQSVGDKIAFKAAEGTSSIDERAQFWSQSLVLSGERPLFGYGPYSFRFAQPHLMADVFATSDHPHNVFLKYAAERGWPAAIAFMAFLLYVIGLSLSHLFFDRKNNWSLESDARTVALLLGVVGVVAHNLIDYNLQFVGIALPLWIALALLSTHLAETRPVSRASFAHWRMTRSFSRIEAVFLMLLFLVTVWEGTFLIVSSFGRYAEAQGNERAALDWYEKASPEWFSRDLLLSRARLLEEQGLLDDADTVLGLSLVENSVDARAWRMRAELAVRRNQAELAYRYAMHAYALGRYTDIGILRVVIDTGRALQRDATVPANEKPDLRARKQDFDALFSAYAEAIEHNSHHIALGESVEELQTVANQLAELFPTDAKRYRQIAADAARHAEIERSTYAARPVGLLW